MNVKEEKIILMKMAKDDIEELEAKLRADRYDQLSHMKEEIVKLKRDYRGPLLFSPDGRTVFLSSIFYWTHLSTKKGGAH